MTKAITIIALTCFLVAGAAVTSVLSRTSMEASVAAMPAPVAKVPSPTARPSRIACRSCATRSPPSPAQTASEWADPPGLCVVLARRFRGRQGRRCPAESRPAACDGAGCIRFRQCAGFGRACAGQAEGGRGGRQAGSAEILRVAVGCADRRYQGAAEADVGPGILLAGHRERAARHRAQDPRRAPA